MRGAKVSQASHSGGMSSPLGRYIFRPCPIRAPLPYVCASRPSFSARVQTRCNRAPEQTTMRAPHNYTIFYRRFSTPAPNSPDTEKPPLHIRIWNAVKHEAAHYWAGTKALLLNVKLTYRILREKFAGRRALKRSERKLVKRTLGDLLRLFNLVPILVIPAAELALPVLIKIFPGFLPTTYLTRLQVEMKMREKLRKKRQVCVELQDSTEKIFQQIKLESMPEAFSRDVQPQQIQAWWNRMKAERLAVDEILHFARLFHELFALEKLPREKLQRIARFLGVGEGGSTQYLIHKINVKIARLRSDDEDILEEGLGTMTDAELEAANASRGVQAIGLSREQQLQMLQDWIQLVSHALPPYLLVLSRSATLSDDLAERLAQVRRYEAQVQKLEQVDPKAAQAASQKLAELKEQVASRAIEEERLAKELAQKQLEEQARKQKEEQERKLKAEEEQERLSREAREQQEKAVLAAAAVAEESTRAEAESRALDEAQRQQQQQQQVLLAQQKLEEEEQRATAAEAEEQAKAKAKAKEQVETVAKEQAEAQVKAQAEAEEKRKAEEAEAQRKAAEEERRVQEVKARLEKAAQEGRGREQLHSPVMSTLSHQIETLIDSMDKTERILSLKKDATALQLAFQMMDADKNGKLSMDELRKALERIGGHIENEDLLALFQHIDHNKDGKIDFNEFKELVEQLVVDLETQSLRPAVNLETAAKAEAAKSEAVKAEAAAEPEAAKPETVKSAAATAAEKPAEAEKTEPASTEAHAQAQPPQAPSTPTDGTKQSP